MRTRTTGHPLHSAPDRCAVVRTALPVLAVAVLVCTAACSAPAPSAASSVASHDPVAPAAPTASRTPSVTSVSAAEAGTAAPAEPAGHEQGRVSLPWPAATTVEAAALQRTVDSGAQPWLLDPSEVAQAYARAVGWSNAQISAGSGTSPTLATVRSPAGSRTLTLRQPVRPGAGGIWLVTVDSAP